ncbi:GNAT family N-acetyltransferase [Paucibacter soli]|uniref:GNAT family N-acetyltransferase n=1 Tax=Paucibacter soli TaxID=3133433 RepID=UPI0030AFAC19
MMHTMPAIKTLVRQALRADIPAIWELRYAVTENTIPRGIIADEEVRQAIEERGRGWVIEEIDEFGHRLLAFGIVHADDGCLWALFVHPKAQGRGHGRRLLTEMCDWLWARGLQTLWLSTGAGTRAEALYRRLGWRCTGNTANGDLRFELQREARHD